MAESRGSGPACSRKNRSISISLDERLLAQLDALHNAYADLARLNGGDLDAAGDDTISMALELLTPGARAERSRLYLWPRNRSFGESTDQR